MKTFVLGVSLVACVSGVAIAAEIDGAWLVADESVIVEIGLCDERSEFRCGIITTILDDSINDRDAGLLCGLPILWDLRPDSDPGAWTYGKIYDPERDRQYDLSASMENGSLDIHAKLGLLGHRETWTRPKGTPDVCW